MLWDTTDLEGVEEPEMCCVIQKVLELIHALPLNFRCQSVLLDPVKVKTVLEIHFVRRWCVIG